MTLEEDVKVVENDLGLVFQLKNLQGIKQLAGKIMERIKVFKAIDEVALVKLQEALFQIYNFKTAEDVSELMPLVREDAVNAFNQIKVKLGQQEKAVGKHPIFLPTYVKAREKYSSYEKQIEKLEYEIRTRQDLYDKKLNEPLKYSKKYKGHLHARLTENLRIVYYFDEELNTVYFENIITHDELEKS